MPRIGDTLQPGLNVYDPSPYLNAQARATQSIGSSLSSGIGAIGDAVEKRKEFKDSVKASTTKLKAAKELFGDKGGYLDTLLMQIEDEEQPLSTRAALAGTANELLALGIDKMNTDRQFAIQDRGMQLEERRISEGARQFDTSLEVDQYQAETQQNFANETAKDEGINKMIAAQDLADKFKLPRSPGLEDRFRQAMDSGDGAAVKSVAEEYLGVVRPQAEAAAKAGGRELKTIKLTLPDGRPGEMDAFVDPATRAITDIYGNPINPDAYLESPADGTVLPPKSPPAWGDGTGGETLPPVEQGRRIQPMPKTTFGQRPMVSPNETPEQALAKARMTGADARLTETLQGAETLAGTLDNLNQTEKLLDEVRTGFGAESIVKAKRMFGADVANAEQLQTLLGDQVMARVAQTKGAVSEREMDLFQQFSANFGKTPEGNKKIVQFAKKAATRAKKISKVINDGFKSGKTPFAIQAEIIEIQNNEPISDDLSPPSGKMDDEDDAASQLRAFGQ